MKIKKMAALLLSAAVSISAFTALPASAATAEETRTAVTLFNDTNTAVSESVTWDGDFQNNDRPQLKYYGNSTAATKSLTFTANVTTLKKIIVNEASKATEETYTAKIGDTEIGTTTYTTSKAFVDADVTIDINTTEIGDKQITLSVTTQETYINSVTLVYSNTYSVTLIKDSVINVTTTGLELHNSNTQLKHQNNGDTATLTFQADMTNLDSIVVNAASAYEETFTATVPGTDGNDPIQVGTYHHAGRSGNGNWGNYDNTIIITGAQTGVQTLTITDTTSETYFNSVTLIYNDGSPAVAKIGDTEYKSFDNAMAAAQANDIITLLADVTYSIKADKAVKVDGGAEKHKLTYTGTETPAFADGCTFENVKLDMTTHKNFANYAILKNVTIDNPTDFDCLLLNDGTLENCTITGYKGIGVIANNGHNYITVKDTTITGSQTNATGWTKSAAVRIYSATNAVIDGSTITGTTQNNVACPDVLQNGGSLTLKNACTIGELHKTGGTLTLDSTFSGTVKITGLTIADGTEVATVTEGANIIGITVDGMTENYVLQIIDGKLVIKKKTVTAAGNIQAAAWTFTGTDGKYEVDSTNTNKLTEKATGKAVFGYKTTNITAATGKTYNKVTANVKNVEGQEQTVTQDITIINGSETGVIFYIISTEELETSATTITLVEAAPSTAE